MAKKEAGATLVRVLCDCIYGAANQVVSLAPEVAETAVASGLVDSSPEAVEYAKGLSK
jgi:hypothetical protein